MNLVKWAIKWGVSIDALDDLNDQLGLSDNVVLDNEAGKSEGAIQALVRLEASKKGLRLFRNNVGVAMNKDGIRCLRYGLANDSELLNDVLKSSDLIGIRRVLITESMVGNTFGQFVAREIKESGWCYSGSKRELAQLAFIKLITSYGGDACFASGTGSL